MNVQSFRASKSLSQLSFKNFLQIQVKFSNKTLSNIFTSSSSFTIHNPFLNAYCAVRCASFWCNLFDLCQWFLQESNCRHVYYSKFTSYLLIMSKVVWNLLSCHSLLNIHKLQTKRQRHCCHFIAYWVGVFLWSKQLSRAFPLFKCQCFQSHVKVHIYFKHLNNFRLPCHADVSSVLSAAVSDDHV